MHRPGAGVLLWETLMRRAVIYCRVSTDEEIQVNALASQVKEAEEAADTKAWVLVDKYIDEGKSGTTTKNRNEYNRLLLDMESDKFDIIVVKSQDRLMRNTREWYVFVDKLVQWKKQLYFYLDGRFYTPDDALITGIKAILSEEYSRDLSKKINNAHRHRQESGSALVLTSKTWGYDKVNKRVVVNEAEAKIVRLIFGLYVSGMGSRTVAKELYNRGMKSRSGHMFQETTVRNIIRNPLYMGTAVMNRRHYDFNSKKIMPLPEEAWIVHENAVPAIIDEATWKKANRMMDERSVRQQGGNSAIRRGVNKGRHELSGKIVCGICGSTYWRRGKRNAKGEETYYWACAGYLQHGRLHNDTNRGKNKKKTDTDGGCDNIHLNDATLKEALYRLSKKIFQTDKNNLADEAMNILQQVLLDFGETDVGKLRSERNKIKAQREKLLEGYLSDVVDAGMYRRKDRELLRELNRIQTEIDKREQDRTQTENDKRAQDKTQTEIDKRELNSQEAQELGRRLQSLRDEVADITDKELGVKKLLSFVSGMKVFPEHIDVAFECGKTERIRINRINYCRVELILDGEADNQRAMQEFPFVSSGIQAGLGDPLNRDSLRDRHAVVRRAESCGKEMPAW